MSSILSWFNWLIPRFRKKTKAPKYLTNISYKFLLKTTNTLIVYNISKRTLKDLKIYLRDTKTIVKEITIDELPYRSSVEFAIDELANQKNDLKLTIFCNNHWDKFVLKQEGNISRIK